MLSIRQSRKDQDLFVLIDNSGHVVSTADIDEILEIAQKEIGEGGSLTIDSDTLEKLNERIHWPW